LKNLLKRERFRRYGWLTVSAVFVLILLGGIVRSTGSGMGCPDWPKCFGQYIPPTQESQLPQNYQEDFSAKRVKKAEKFAKMLASFGFEKQANDLLNDPNLYLPEEFNPVKTWIEYLNRLWGALTGIFALLALITGVQYFKSHKTIALLSIFGVFLIFFNAWLGSILVSTNLTSWVITVHYLMAYLAIFILMIASYLAKPIIQLEIPKTLGVWIGVTLLLTFVQIISGTSLRAVSDVLVKTDTLLINGEVNIEGLGVSFNWHRVLALIVGAINLAILVFLKRQKGIQKKVLSFQYLILVLIALQVLSGSLNLNYSFPVIAQVHHIFGAGILFGVQAYMFLAASLSTK